MKPVDTHAHLQFKAYDPDREEVTRRSSEELGFLINVGTSVDASEKGIALSEKFDNFFASIGVHPHHVDQWDHDTREVLRNLGQNQKVVAVGEIGLDNHLYKGYPQPNLNAQAKILHEQIQLAIELDKPILFHCRDAYDELLDVITNFRGSTPRGLVHCFMGNKEQAKKFLDLGLYISFSGNLTYKGNDYIREVARYVPEDRILSETDSPFLPPEPHRGKRNEPLYVKIIVTTIAQLRGWDEQKATATTSQNAKDLLKLP